MRLTLTITEATVGPAIVGDPLRALEHAVGASVPVPTWITTGPVVVPVLTFRPEIVNVAPGVAPEEGVTTWNATPVGTVEGGVAGSKTVGEVLPGTDEPFDTCEPFPVV